MLPCPYRPDRVPSGLLSNLHVPVFDPQEANRDIASFCMETATHTPASRGDGDRARQRSGSGCR